jgi:hypothetical protein
VRDCEIGELACAASACGGLAAEAHIVCAPSPVNATTANTACRNIFPRLSNLIRATPN